MRRTTILCLGAVLALAGVAPAAATSGPGCYRVVNVEDWDVLNVRAGPSANAPVVGTIPPRQHGIISQTGPCVPPHRPPPSRWCQITHFTGSGSAKGFVKRRYLAANDCP